MVALPACLVHIGGAGGPSSMHLNSTVGFLGKWRSALSHFVLFRPPRCRGFQCIRSVLHTRGGYMIARSSRAGRGNIQVVHPVPMFFPLVWVFHPKPSLPVFFC